MARYIEESEVKRMIIRRGWMSEEELENSSVVADLPSAESRWIPVTERLPEDGAEVWVTTDMLFEVTRARWHEDSNLWCHPYYSDCVLALRPIAWMPYERPEPYKGGAESHYCPNCGADMKEGSEDDS